MHAQECENSTWLGVMEAPIRNTTWHQLCAAWLAAGQKPRRSAGPLAGWTHAVQCRVHLQGAKTHTRTQLQGLSVSRKLAQSIERQSRDDRGSRC